VTIKSIVDFRLRDGEQPPRFLFQNDLMLFPFTGYCPDANPASGFYYCTSLIVISTVPGDEIHFPVDGSFFIDLGILVSP